MTARGRDPRGWQTGHLANNSSQEVPAPVRTDDVDAFYVARGDGTFASTGHTAGPWTPDAQHLGPPSALLARAIEQVPADRPTQIARVTVEILGPVPLADLTVRARLTRPGRSVELLAAELATGDRVVATASAWRIARADSGPVAAGVALLRNRLYAVLAACAGALAAVGADWVADLPNGLDTELGRNYVLDDAGAQQLSLARVVLADPHTVILDEATALLDPRTARQTEQSLAAVLHGRTVIAIAHRLQTAHDSDRIAVMEKGELVELGTHDELVTAGGTYGKLWRTWHAEPEEPSTG
jgi:hypothetical protein